MRPLGYQSNVSSTDCSVFLGEPVIDCFSSVVKHTVLGFWGLELGLLEWTDHDLPLQ